MQTNAVAATPTTPQQSAQKTEGLGLAEDFDSFLKLLTTQLANQDPLEPLDADQFTRQLVQFSGVEQAIKTNSMLEELVGLVRTDQFARGIDYLGATVEAQGATVRLGSEHDAQIRYSLEADAAQVTIRVRDETGKLVFQGPGEPGAGQHSIPWDGRDLLGNRLPDGLYRAEITATGASGQAIPAATTIRGVVDGVETQGERLLLSVDGVLVGADQVTRIRHDPPEG